MKLHFWRTTSHVPMWKLRRWLPVFLSPMFAAPVFAQQPAGLPQPAAQPPVLTAPAKPVVEEPKVSFTFEDRPWGQVLDWFARESNLVMIATDKPTGSVTIKTDPMKKYTISEVVDLLNRSLALQNFILLRIDSGTFTVLPSDKKIPDTYIHRVLAVDLPKKANTEIVQVALQLKTLNADEVLEQVRTRKGPFGDVKSIGANQLLITDTAGNIRTIIEDIIKIDEAHGDSLTYRCKFIRATEAADTLKALLSDGGTNVTTTAAIPPGGFGGFGGFQPPQAPPARGPAISARFRTVNISVLEKSNTVLITGPADKLATAEKFLKDLDVGQPGQKEVITGEPVLKIYSVPPKTADGLAKVLQEFYVGSKLVRIAAIPGKDEIMVLAPPGDQFDIMMKITQPPDAKPNASTKLLPIVSGRDPKEIADAIKRLVPDTGSGPLIDPVTEPSPGVIIKGTPAQLLEAEAAKQLIDPTAGVGASGASSNFRVLPIDGANAGIMAELVADTLRKMGKPVELRGVEQPKPPAAPPPMALPGTAPPPMERKSQANPREAQPIRLAQGVNGQRNLIAAQITDPAAQPKPANPNEKPITITVIGNKIVVASEDPTAVETVTQLINLIKREGTKTDENMYEVLRLKNVNAEDAAKVISEVFNGPSQQQQGGGGRGGGGGFNPLQFLTQFAGAGAAAPTSPSAGRIRVVAEKQSNSLIVVKASPIDLLQIKKLLEKAIDSYPDTDATSAMKTWLIPLSYATAADISTTINSVYANLMQARGGNRAQTAQAFPFPIPGMPQQASQPVAQLTVGTDERTNTVIVNCNEAIYKDIHKLVTTLDEAAKDQNDVVEVVKLEGIDPLLVQQAIQALMGQRAASQTGQQRTGGIGGGFTPGGGGFGMPGTGGGFGNFGGGTRGGFGGGGFTPGGGRGGAGIGSFGGTGGGGRGGATGGRGGATGGRGGTRRSDIPNPLDGSGGRDFFEYRDMDVPSAQSTLFDPDAELSSNNNREYPTGLQLAQAQVPVPMGGAAQQPGAGQPGQAQPPGNMPPAVRPQVPRTGAPGEFTDAPVSPVQADALEELGIIVLRARNREDMAKLLAFIKYISGEGKDAEVELIVYPVQNYDPTSLVNLLNTIFSRVNINVGSTQLIPGNMAQRPGGGFGGLLGALGGQNQQAQTVGSIFMLPLPRQNSILIAVPRARKDAILKMVKEYDQPNNPNILPKEFRLKNISAQIASQQLQTFFSQRYSSTESSAQNQVRITYSTANNSVIVQAGQADMKDIEFFLELLDKSENGATNELRLYKLKYAFSDEIAQVLITALNSSVLNPSAQGTSSTLSGGTGAGSPFATGAGGGLGALFGGGGQGQLGALGGQQRAGGLGGTGALGSSTTGITTRTSSLQFYSADGKTTLSGSLTDVQIIPDARINGVLISAPEKTMRLIEKLIEEIDVPSAAKADVKVFTLKKADATFTAQLLANLFSSAARTGAAGGGLGGLGGQLGALGGTNTQAISRPLLTLTGAEVSEGATLLDLRLSVDNRTNSIIVAGSQTDLDTIRAVIARLEDSEAPRLETRVYKLRNAAAADVSTNVLTFLQQKLQLEAGQQFAAAYQQLQRSVFIQQEPVTNTLMIAASSQYLPEVISIIEKMDAPPQQVLVQVLIAEVQLNNTQEFGVELGLQSPVLFARSSTGTSPGTPGYNFNTTTALPNTTTGTQQGVVGFQGLGNLGVGRSGSTGIGGFVFSAASDTFNLLIRALKAQNRVEVLSRPQLTLTDNQAGFFQVGQNFPIPGGLSQGVGGTITGVQYVDIGIQLRVTPRINPDGKVLMRVEPQITNPSQQLISLGNGQNATAFDTQTVQTTILASDGETIILGGLIRRQDSRVENKIPLLGDVPYLGSAFRYRSQQQTRRELIFIVTPHILRSEEDRARVTAEETRKMNWCLPEVVNIHTHGEDVLSGRNPYLSGGNSSPIFTPSYGLPTNSIALPSQSTLPGGIVPDAFVAPNGVNSEPYPRSLPGGVVPDAGTESIPPSSKNVLPKQEIPVSAQPMLFPGTNGNPPVVIQPQSMQLVMPAGWTPPANNSPMVQPRTLSDAAAKAMFAAPQEQPKKQPENPAGTKPAPSLFPSLNNKTSQKPTEGKQPWAVFNR